MKKREIYFALILLFLHFSITAQTFEEDIKKMNTAYQANFISEMTVTEINGNQKQRIAKKIEVIKTDQGLYTQMGGVINVNLPSYRIMVIEEDKTIMVQKVTAEEYEAKNNTQQIPKIDSIASHYDTIQKINTNSSLSNYLLVSKGDMIEKTLLSLRENGSIKKIYYTYSSDYSEGDTLFQVEILMSYQPLTATHEKLNTSYYFVQKGEAFEVAPTYKSYKLIQVNF